MRPRSFPPLLVAVCVGLVVATGACASKHQVAVQNSPTGSGISTSPTTSVPASSSVPSSSSTPSSTPATTATVTAAPPAPTDFQPQSVTFVSPDAGYALGSAPCASGTCTTVVATPDAGNSWLSVGTLPPKIGLNGDVSKLRFADANDGWAFGPQLWATHDGGRSWKQIPESASVTDVEAAAGQAYALVGNQVLHTSVATDSWASIAGVSGNFGNGSIALHGSAVWLVSGGGPGSATLVTSTDGHSWRTLADPCASLGSDWAIGGVAPVGAADVYLLCGGGAGAGSEAKKVLYSTDGGAHATATAADPPMGGDAGDIAAASASVVAVSARSGASEVYRSGDSGHTWQTVLQQGDGGVGYFDLGFTTSTQGVVIYGQLGSGLNTPTRLLMTHDAGATWKAVTF